MPRRSRACQACRKRRIGCDGALPSCRQCLLSNRPCSGPVQGPIIINQTDSTISRHHNSSQVRRKRGSDLARQPSSAGFVSIAVISKFIYFLTSADEGPSKRPWLYGLDDIALADRGPVLDLALQAAATAFYGMSSKNDAALVEARQMYGRSLVRLSGDISQAVGTPVASKIYVSVILSLFEAIWSTNSNAYAMHLAACRQMLSLEGPRLKQNKLLQQVAAHVRYQSLFALIATPGSWQMSLEERQFWTDAHWLGTEHQQQLMIDRLVVELYSLQKLLSDSPCVGNSTNEDATAIGVRINNLWAEYLTDARERGQPIDVRVEGGLQYRDSFTALTVAYFAAAWLLLGRFGAITAGAIDSPCSTSASHSCQTILTCSSLLTRRDIGCAYLRMFLPLTLVGLYGPLPEHRTLAYTQLKQWFSGTSFRGLGSLALQRIQSVAIGY